MLQSVGHKKLKKKNIYDFFFKCMIFLKNMIFFKNIIFCEKNVFFEKYEFFGCLPCFPALPWLSSKNFSTSLMLVLPHSNFYFFITKV